MTWFEYLAKNTAGFKPVKDNKVMFFIYNMEHVPGNIVIYSKKFLESEVRKNGQYEKNYVLNK